FIRYADDGVFGFEHREDAEQVMRVLEERLKRFGLKMNRDKTRLIDFRRPPIDQSGGKGPTTFEFLGFTLYWRRSVSRRRWVMTCKTRRARLQKAKMAITEWCRRQRHAPVRDQHAALRRRLQGHFNYFGARGNQSNLNLLLEHAKRTWFKWLNRRSQRQRLTWERFSHILRLNPLPAPHARFSLWGVTP